MFDFTPATKETARLLAGIRPEHLGGLSPCEKWQVAQVVDHLLGVTVAFTYGARKKPQPMDGAPPEPSKELPAGWREELPRRLDTLAAAWREPSAWSGMTKVGGVDLPSEVCALVALDEVMVHSWDLAVATGQELAVDERLAGALYEFWSAQDGDEGDLPVRQVIFGEPVEVPGQAPVFDRVLGLTGRDPRWRAADQESGESVAQGL